MNAMHHSILCEFMNNIGFMVFGNHLIPLDPAELLPFGDPNGNARFTGYYNDTISVFRATRDIAAGEEIRMCRPSYICLCPLCSIPPPAVALRLNQGAFPLIPASGSFASSRAVDEEKREEANQGEERENNEESKKAEQDEEDEEGLEDVEIPKRNKGKGKAIYNVIDNGEGPSSSREERQATDPNSGSGDSPLTFRAALALPAPGPGEPRTLDPLRMNPANPSTGTQQQKKDAKSDSGGDSEHVENVVSNDGANDVSQDKKPSRTARFKLVLKKKFGIKDKSEVDHQEVSHNKDNQAEGHQIEDNQSGVKQPGDSQPASEHQELA
ncbi:hypothetical protein CSAL01_10216 [Colletotrichum salicis]|uniref:SET domain-containing protein n=1 Tax=Colletotrichum salicis TaxID=1209931 RepID=A0A135TA11_9PEZI|nr:hypothetical protein CSAL01_10216 [Colletotrichum salicis]